MQNINSQPAADEENLEIAGICSNPKCRKVFIVGQSVVNRGEELFCNFNCLSHYMFGGNHGV